MLYDESTEFLLCVNTGTSAADLMDDILSLRRYLKNLWLNCNFPPFFLNLWKIWTQKTNALFDEGKMLLVFGLSYKKGLLRNMLGSVKYVSFRSGNRSCGLEKKALLVSNSAASLNTYFPASEIHGYCIVFM